jgi:hypothetical protein
MTSTTQLSHVGTMLVDDADPPPPARCLSSPLTEDIGAPLKPRRACCGYELAKHAAAGVRIHEEWQLDQPTPRCSFPTHGDRRSCGWWSR